jgi:hypothetical protein
VLHKFQKVILYLTVVYTKSITEEEAKKRGKNKNTEGKREETEAWGERLVMLGTIFFFFCHLFILSLRGF